MYERDFAILHPHVPVLCQEPCHWGNVCYYAVTDNSRSFCSYFLI